jgi:sugar transferase (PEP-CTERM/EpsH1 system associated)
MNILFVVPYVPTRIRVRPYNLIRHLARLGHRITLLTVSTSEDEREALEHLEKHCEKITAVILPAWRSIVNCLLALPTNRPLQTVYSWDASLSRDCYDLALRTNGSSAIDVVHIEHLRGARYGVELKSRLSNRKPILPVVYDSVDSISLLFRQAMMQSKSIVNRGLTWFELGRTERYESWLLDQFDQVLVTSQADKKALLSLQRQEEELPEIMVLPNGVDLDYFTPPEGFERERKTIVLSGKMSYHANVTMVMGFVEEIMPHVWSQQPGVQVWIVGKDPPPKMQALNQNPNIKVTGTVEDIRPYLQNATLAASPITYGVGIQNKVLEAMACATPVIASKQAVSALDVKSGEDAIVVDDHISFAREVLTLMNDPDRQKGLGRAGRRYVEKNHDWSVVATRLEDVYSRTLERIRTGTSVN